METQTDMLITIIIGLATATLLLLAGYLFGIKRGHKVREQLREQLFEQKDLKIDTLLQQSDALQRVIEPLADWDTQVEKLHASIQQMQASMVNHDQVALELSNLQTSSKDRGGLSILMDEIANKAQFESVLLCNENGLPLVSSNNAKDLERLAAIASFVVIFGDRMSRDDSPSPVSFLVRDSNNKDILCRIFHVGKQRLIITAVSIKQQLTSSALDPALEKVISLLSSR
jgi:hypothetical protein